MREESPFLRVDDRHTRTEDEMDYEDGERDELQAYQMRRTWESRLRLLAKMVYFK